MSCNIDVLDNIKREHSLMLTLKTVLSGILPCKG